MTSRLLILLFGVAVSSCAGVYSEWVLKRKPASAFYVQSVYLYFWGVFFNFCALLAKDYSNVAHHGFFSNYNWWCLAVVFTQAGFGLSVAVTFKFLDNIAAVYSHSLAMLFTMCGSAIWLDFEPTATFLVGLVAVIASLYLYHKGPDHSDPGQIDYQKVGEDGQLVMNSGDSVSDSEECQYGEDIAADADRADTELLELPRT